MTGPANGFQLSWNIPLVCQERKHQWRLRSERNVKVYRTDFNCLLAIFVHAGANCRDAQAALMILCTLFQKKNQDSLIYIYEEHEVAIHIDGTVFVYRFYVL